MSLQVADVAEAPVDSGRSPHPVRRGRSHPLGAYPDAEHVGGLVEVLARQRAVARV